MSLFDSASLVVTPNGYKEDKLYSIKPTDGSGDLVVTRATTATRVNSDGLIEVTPYNLLTYSEQFDNAAWIKSDVSTTSNSTIAPNGTLSADTITDTSTFGIIYQNYSDFNASEIVTFSVYLKKTNNDWVNVSTSRSSSTSYGEFGAWFNLSTGAIGSNYLPGAGVLINKEIESVGNGWYRCSITGYVPNATAYLSFVFNSNADNSLVSSIGQSHYQWGAQLVSGTSAKEYFPTTDRLNVPRLDYTNSSCPSILVEPQRTNVVVRSQEFDNASWIKLDTNISANSTISPDGTNNADKIIPNTTNIFHAIYQAIPIGTYSFSIYAKFAGEATFSMWLNDFGKRALFDLSNGTIPFSNVANSTITDAGNGWYKCTVYDNTLTSFVAIYGRNGASFSGNGTDGFYLWGAQAEIGSYATSYIPTIASSVTRNADVISKTGISSLIGQTEGTMFVDFNVSDLASQTNDPVIFSFNSSNYIEIFADGRVNYYDGSGNIDINLPSYGLTNGRHKFGIAYNTNDVAFYIDGSLAGTDTSCTPSAKSNLYLGFTNLSFLPKLRYNSVQLYKTRLSNSELAQLTTI